jgi:YHS domain-containing protein
VVAEQLVRDRVCDTYLPRSRALREVDASGREQFFCSEECRAKHHQASA